MSFAMPPDLWVWIAIVGVSGSTVLTRAGLLLLGDRLKMPAIVDRALAYAPACALAAIIVPELVLSHGELLLGTGNHRLVAALAGAAAFAFTRSLLATIGVGMLVFTLLRLLA
ncbi:MAG: AzlD domain-containing protein [Gammaproteobacteria bacterium]|nr:AzlD domain-containing protein [Gammaproteobacteria bacterium]